MPRFLEALAAAPAPAAPGLSWDRDGRDWPHREASRFVRAGGIRWHVQVFGDGPAVLLVHGAGAASHSWRDVVPRLGGRLRLVVPDLPGHGFTQAPPPEGFGASGMGRLLESLLEALGIRPVVAVGHSAGAALLARMALDGRIAARALASVNGALVAPHGIAWRLFGPSARVLASLPATARVFCALADPARVERLAASTGSRLDPAGIELYSRLAASPGHVASVLAMMARWDLEALERDLPRLRQPLHLAVGERDLAVLPGEAERVRRLVPGPAVRRWPGLGHLAHEEDPARFAEFLDEVLAGLPRAVPAP